MGNNRDAVTNADEQEFRTLHKQYEEYVRNERSAWLARAQLRFKNVYEVMSEAERRDVQQCMFEWEYYITPLAEAWWKERGWTIHWPSKNTDGCRFTKD